MPREQWRTRHGFVLATIGSAVGLGNIWRFSYVAGENGGGAFLLVYLVSVLLVGAPLMISELALGRRGGGDAVSAFQHVRPGSRWGFVGWLGVAAAVAILSYYAVIAGWTLKYVLGAVSGELWVEAASGYGAYFAGFIASAEPILWQATMLLVAVAVVAGGVQRGIEASSRILMPLLAVMVVALAIHGLTLDGGGRSLEFLFAPDWAMLGRSEVLYAALGQSFFSLGVGMAVFLTYGSYLAGTMSIPASALTIAVGDTLFALCAGIAIFSAVFTFGLDPQAGPQLAFITLPQVFLSMPAGTIVGLLFFGLLVLAALTSMISLIEVAVAVVIERSGMSRRRAAMAVGLLVFVLGLPSALSFGALGGWSVFSLPLLDFVDHVASNLMLPIGGLLTAVFVGWRWTRAEAVASADLSGPLAVAWIWLMRLVVPLTIFVVLLASFDIL